MTHLESLNGLDPAISHRYIRDGKLVAEVWKSGTRYRLMPGNKRFAQAVQRLLNYYPSGTQFEVGEEPVFSVSETRLREALCLLGVK